MSESMIQEGDRSGVDIPDPREKAKNLLMGIHVRSEVLLADWNGMSQIELINETKSLKLFLDQVLFQLYKIS